MSDRPTVALSFSSILAEPQSYLRRSIRSRRRRARRSARREPIEDGERDALLGPGEVKVLAVAAHGAGCGSRAAQRPYARRSAEGAAHRHRAHRAVRRRRRIPHQARRRPADHGRSGHRDRRSRHRGGRAAVEGGRREGLDPRAARPRSATTAGRRRFAPKRIGRHLYTIEAWRDDYASLVHEISVKHKAGVDIALELTEARQYLEAVNAKAVPCNTTALGRALQTLHGTDTEASVQALTAPATVKAVAASAERAFRVQHPPLPLEVERPQAEFASWYELFPRSQSGDVQPPRHVRRRDRPPRRYPRDGLRRPLLPADPSDRREEPQGPQQLADARARRSRQPLCDRQPGGRARRDPSAARHARRFPPARGGGARERAGDRARLRDPVLAGSSVAARASRLVQVAAGRLDQVRREPAEEIPGHRQRRFLRRRSVRPLDRAARHRAVLGRRRRAHLPRRQSAHQAAAVLAMDDRRRARALSGRDLPVGSLHAAEDDVPARQGRLLAVLHLLHLAQHQAGTRPTI